MGRYKNDYLKQFSSSKKINDLSLVKTFWILIKNHIRIQISGWIRIRKKRIRIRNIGLFKVVLSVNFPTLR